MSNTPGLITLPATAARLLATEVLLADPETLGDDVLEACLYMCATKHADALWPSLNKTDDSFKTL